MARNLVNRNIETPSGAIATYHIIDRILVFKDGTAEIVVTSYVNEDSYLANKEPVCTNYTRTESLFNESDVWDIAIQVVEAP